MKTTTTRFPWNLIALPVAETNIARFSKSFFLCFIFSASLVSMQRNTVISISTRRMILNSWFRIHCRPVPHSSNHFYLLSHNDLPAGANQLLKSVKQEDLDDLSSLFQSEAYKKMVMSSMRNRKPSQPRAMFIPSDQHALYKTLMQPMAQPSDLKRPNTEMSSVTATNGPMQPFKKKFKLETGHQPQYPPYKHPGAVSKIRREPKSPANALSSTTPNKDKKKSGASSAPSTPKNKGGSHHHHEDSLQTSHLGNGSAAKDSASTPSEDDKGKQKVDPKIPKGSASKKHRGAPDSKSKKQQGTPGSHSKRPPHSSSKSGKKNKAPIKSPPPSPGPSSGI